MLHEFIINENTTLIGQVDRTDESFDHAFGTEKSYSYEIKTMRVIYHNRFSKREVTDSIKKCKPSRFRVLEERFLKDYVESL